MGAWGPGIFDSDAACDTRSAFEDEIAAGATVALATDRVVERFAPDEDEIDGPEIYLALAALQLEYGALQPHIQERALRIIATLQDWSILTGKDRSSSDVAQHLQTLEKLGESLTRYA